MRTDSWDEAAAQHRKHGLVLCDREVREGMGGTEAERKGVYVYLEPIHTAARQKLTQDCTAIIFQWNVKLKKLQLAITSQLADSYY